MINTIIKIGISIMAVLHGYILWFEMFAWETKWKEIFTVLPEELFSQTVEMAANQWLYNWFLAAGLIWSLVIKDTRWSNNIALFFLACILIAWIYGAYTIDSKILFIQSIPSFIILIMIAVDYFKSKS